MSDISQDDQEERREPALSAPPEVPQFASAPEVPRFAGQPAVPRFAPPPAEPPGPADASAPPEAPAFIAPAPAPPASRWTSRLALAGVAVLGVAAVAAGLSWFSGQRKVDRSLEVLAMSARPAGQAGAARPQAGDPVLTAGAQATAATPPAMPAPASEPLPPLVTLPAAEAVPKPPVQGALVAAVARPAKSAPLARQALVKPAVKGKPKAALRKVVATKTVKARARSTRAGATALAPKPLPKLPRRRPCKRGDLARDCLGLPDN